MSIQIQFERGPYGEILPPPLVAGMTLEDLTAILTPDGRALAGIDELPRDAQDELYSLGFLLTHRQQLLQAIAGDMPGGNLPGDADAHALHRAVVDEGQAMSLRPLGQEELLFPGFAPVLQRVAGDRWRVGLQGRGETAEIIAPPGAALRQAWEIVGGWSEADEASWEAEVRQALDLTTYSLFHSFWAWQLYQNGRWERGEFSVVVSDVLILRAPKRVRILDDTPPTAAVWLCDALARRAGSEPAWPQPGEVIAWLEREGIPRPARDTARRQDGWRIGSGTITWHNSGDVAALLIWGGQGRVLMVERDKLFLYPLQGRQAARDEMLAWTALEPPLRDWLRGGEGRAALAMWALWAGELGSSGQAETSELLPN